jgi:HK97 family phage prohead protease
MLLPAPRFETRAAGSATPARERRELSLEIRAVNIEERVIEGYASVFNVIDSYETVFDPGCFTRTLANPVDGGVTVYIGHESNKLPIGLPSEMRVDQYGLYTRTTVAPDPEGDILLARAAWLRENGRPLGISIGFARNADRADVVEGRNIRRIMDVDLWEYSYVGIPSNPRARVTQVRSEDGAELVEGADLTVDELDGSLRSLLREAGALSLEARAGRPMSQRNLDRLHTVMSAVVEVHAGTCDMDADCPHASDALTKGKRSAAPAEERAAEPADEVENPAPQATDADAAEVADTSSEASANPDAGQAGTDDALRAAFARLDNYLVFHGREPVAA